MARAGTNSLLDSGVELLRYHAEAQARLIVWINNKELAGHLLAPSVSLAEL